MKTACYENYPLWIVLMSNAVSILIYLIGAFIFLQLGAVYAIFYVAYVVFLEFRLLTHSCKYCYYHGKTCAFGRGRCSKIITKKGDPRKFIRKNITLKDMLPDFLVFILPMIAGAALLVSSFSWTILIMMVLLLVMSTGGNAFIRGSYACKYCKQGKIGCPALKVFSKR